MIESSFQATASSHNLADLHGVSALYDAVIDEVDGRRLRIGDRWLRDFASCNYLGFDLDPEIIDSIGPAVKAWGTHPSWSRMLGSPRLYAAVEERLTELLGSQDSLALPTITLIHLTVVPVLAAGGWVFLDRRAHRTLYDGCRAAAAAGATTRQYPAGDLDELARLLRQAPARARKLICTDGTNSMTGNLADLRAMVGLARQFDALVYVDDAHGFGVIGQRSPSELCPYGSSGNSIVRHAGLGYDNVVLVGGFSKAYSSLLAFLALPTGLKTRLKIDASPYLYSGPSPVASLATVLAGFDVNAARGDALRADLYRKTAAVRDTIAELGLACPNTSGLPILELPVACPDDVADVGRALLARGLYLTMAAYPLVPRTEVGFRIQVTAANTDDDIQHLCHTLRALADRFRRHDEVVLP